MKYGKRKYRRRGALRKYKRRGIVRRSAHVRRRKYHRRSRRRISRFGVNKVFKEASITYNDSAYLYKLQGDGKFDYHNFSARWLDVNPKMANYILITYDQVKLKKVTMKYWIETPMFDAPLSAQHPEVITLYDPDSSGRSMNKNNMLLSQSAKHRLLHNGRTYKLTLYPNYERISLMAGDLNTKHPVPMKSPWFDVADVIKRLPGSIIEMAKGYSVNGYLLAFKGKAVNQYIRYTLTHTFACRGKRRGSIYM